MFVALRVGSFGFCWLMLADVFSLLFRICLLLGLLVCLLLVFGLLIVLRCSFAFRFCWYLLCLFEFLRILFGCGFVFGGLDDLGLIIVWFACVG